MKILLPLLLLLSFVPMMAQADGLPTFGPETNTLVLPEVKTPTATFNDVIVEIYDYTVIEAKVAVEVPPEHFDGTGGSVGILPNGHTCFLGVTPGCESNPARENYEPIPDLEPDPGPAPCGFGPARPECKP